MKKILCVALGLMAFQNTPVFAQAPPPSLGHLVMPAPSADFETRLHHILGANANPEPPLTKFNLDFPGGTPAELAKAIEKSTGKPLNVIIPDEFKDQKLIPTLKMQNVDAPQLFMAIGNMSAKYSRDGNALISNFGFKTQEEPVTDSSIWSFYAMNPAGPHVENLCVYYSLSPYLDRGFTVDDITTAIQAGWKMSGANPVPELNYHKETRMIIAYGERDKVLSIQQVLQTLPSADPAYWRQTEDRMKKMQQQIDQLQQQLAGMSKPQLAETWVPTGATNPPEKSGK